MSLASPRRVVAAVAILAATALNAASGSSVAGSSAADDDSFVGAGGYTYPSPTNAAKIFKWGAPAWTDEFETKALSATWKVSRSGQVVQQQGQITMNAQRRGTVTASPTDTRAAYGRWETRVRAKQYDDDTAYRFFWELVPVAKTACPDRSDGRIVIASWAQDDPQALGSIGVSKDLAFTFGADVDLRIGYFHTYAIEIAPDHVSWFVDREVVHTETRPEALTGLVYKPRLRMQAVPGATMARSRMQADWVRYYTLDRPGALPIEAPEMTSVASPVTC